MRTPVCDTLGIEYPILAFSHCRDVVAAVTRAGGMGVLGGAAFDPAELDAELDWLDRETDGQPYGVDLVLPVTYAGDDGEALRASIPDEHRRFVADLMQRFRIPEPGPEPSHHQRVRGHERARALWDVTRRHPVRLLASALGPAPGDILEQAHRHDILVAGLVGAPKHVARHLEAGTDVLVAQGTEAGGHSGDVSTLVLVPQVVDLAGGRPVLAAGGIADGRQVTAALALGAQGVWTGSVWLTTAESDVHPGLQDKLLHAGSTDTIRSRCRTGKMVRQLRTPWVDAWEAPGAPDPLPAPLQQMLVGEAQASMIRNGVVEPMGTPIGQVVGMMRSRRSARAVLEGMVEQFVEAFERLEALADDSRDGPVVH